MQYVRSALSSVSDFYKDLNPSTLSGAIDIVVVEREDGTWVCSPFHVRFGKMHLLRPHEKVVDMTINGEKVPYQMKVGEAGEAFFVVETHGPVEAQYSTSPLHLPQDGAPTSALSPLMPALPVTAHPHDEEAHDEQLTEEMRDAPKVRSDESPPPRKAIDDMYLAAVDQEDAARAEKVGADVTRGARSLSFTLPHDALPSNKTIDKAADKVIQQTEKEDVPKPTKKAGSPLKASMRRASSSDASLSDAATPLGSIEKVADVPTEEEERPRQSRTASPELPHTASPAPALSKEDILRFPMPVSPVPRTMPSAKQGQVRLNPTLRHLDLDTYATPRMMAQAAAHVGEPPALLPTDTAIDDALASMPTSTVRSRASSTASEPDRSQRASVTAQKIVHDLLGQVEEQMAHPPPMRFDADNVSVQSAPLLSHPNAQNNEELASLKSIDTFTGRLHSDSNASMNGYTWSWGNLPHKRDASPTPPLTAHRPLQTSHSSPAPENTSASPPPPFSPITPQEARNSPPELKAEETSLTVNKEMIRWPTDGRVHVPDYIQFSLCGAALANYTGQEPVAAVFDRFRVTYEDFCRDQTVLASWQLLIRIDQNYYTLPAVLPLLTSLAVFGKPPTEAHLAAALKSAGTRTVTPDGRRYTLKRFRSWFAGGEPNSPTTPMHPLPSAPPTTSGNLTEKGPSLASTLEGQSTTPPPVSRSPSPEPRHGEGMVRSYSTADALLRQEESKARSRQSWHPSAATSPAFLKSDAETSPRHPVVSHLSDSEASYNRNDRPRTYSAPLGHESARSDSDTDSERPRVSYTKTLRLTDQQLKTLNLNFGANQVTFSVTTRLQGTAMCSAKIFLWRHDTHILISDIDGTITKSDALGHLFTMVGKDWTHPGVAHLFTRIHSNGYEVLYLTSRAIGQAGATRDYLRGIVQQGSHQLPDGPVIMSPDRLFMALRREVIERRPETFKIAALRDIKQLFGADKEPFWAGFGNRITDALSYRSVGVPSSRIFTIDPNGDLKLELLAAYKSSYLKLNELVDHIFPQVKHAMSKDEPVAKAQYTDATFWRPTLPAVNFDDLFSEEEEEEEYEDDMSDASQALFSDEEDEAEETPRVGVEEEEGEEEDDNYDGEDEDELEEGEIREEKRPVKMIDPKAKVAFAEGQSIRAEETIKAGPSLSSSLATPSGSSQHLSKGAKEQDATALAKEAAAKRRDRRQSLSNKFVSADVLSSFPFL